MVAIDSTLAVARDVLRALGVADARVFWAEDGASRIGFVREDGMVMTAYVGFVGSTLHIVGYETGWPVWIDPEAG